MPHLVHEDRADPGLGGPPLHDVVIGGERGTEIRDQLRQLRVGRKLLKWRRPSDEVDVAQLGFP
jgi:hypothetical protein